MLLAIEKLSRHRDGSLTASAGFIRKKGHGLAIAHLTVTSMMNWTHGEVIDGLVALAESSHRERPPEWTAKLCDLWVWLLRSEHKSWGDLSAGLQQPVTDHFENGKIDSCW